MYRNMCTFSVNLFIYKNIYMYRNMCTFAVNLFIYMNIYICTGIYVHICSDFSYLHISKRNIFQKRVIFLYFSDYEETV